MTEEYERSECDFGGYSVEKNMPEEIYVLPTTENTGFQFCGWIYNYEDCKQMVKYIRSDLTNENRESCYLDNLSNVDEGKELLEIFDLLLYHQEDLHHKQAEQFIRILKQALQNHIPDTGKIVDVGLGGALESLRLHALENGCNELLVNNLCDELTMYLRAKPEIIDDLEYSIALHKEIAANLRTYLDFDYATKLMRAVGNMAEASKKYLEMSEA